MVKKDYESVLYYNKVTNNIKTIAAKNGDTNTISQISKKCHIPSQH